MASFFPEGDTVKPQDNRLRSLQKIVSIGASGISGVTGVYAVTGDPNGVTSATGPAIGVEDAEGRIWSKSGAGNTGWTLVVGNPP